MRAELKAVTEAAWYMKVSAMAPPAAQKAMMTKNRSDFFSGLLRKMTECNSATARHMPATIKSVMMIGPTENPSP